MMSKETPPHVRSIGNAPSRSFGGQSVAPLDDRHASMGLPAASRRTMERSAIADGAPERLDDLELNGLKIIQNPDYFCFGMDAVLLSSFARVNEGERVLDMGTGVGILPILLSAKTGAAHITGLEIQPALADMAGRSVAYNKLEDKVDIVLGDIKEAKAIFGSESFNVVVSNPPYMKPNGGLKNEKSAKTIARHEVECTLEDVISQAAAVLPIKGRCYFVHRPARMADLISLMREYKLEPKRIKAVHPYADKDANLILVEGVRGANPQITLEPPLIVYKKNGEYTDEIYEKYGKKRQ